MSTEQQLSMGHRLGFWPLRILNGQNPCRDMDSAWEAVRLAKYPRVHIFLATSQIHMEYKLKMTPDQVCFSGPAVSIQKLALSCATRIMTQKNLDLILHPYHRLATSGNIWCLHWCECLRAGGWKCSQGCKVPEEPRLWWHWVQPRRRWAQWSCFPVPHPGGGHQSRSNHPEYPWHGEPKHLERYQAAWWDSGDIPRCWLAQPT